MSFVTYKYVLISDPDNVEYILNNAAIKPVTRLLKSTHNETVADAVTICIYLFNSHAKTAINTPEIIQDIQNLKNSNNNNEVVSNLATIFLDDVNKSN